MKKSDENEIYLSSSPHFSDKSSTSGIMLAVVIALLPLCVYGVILFGIPALVTIIVSTACCVVFEMLFQTQEFVLNSTVLDLSYDLFWF